MSWCGLRVGVWLAGDWGVRLGVGGSLGPCCGGLGVPLWLVGRVAVRWLALPGGLCFVPVSSGAPAPYPRVLWPCLRTLPVPVRWPLWWPGSSPGGEGVLLGCAAVFPAASFVPVARFPRVGLPSIPCVVSAGWWACAGVIRTAFDSCFGAVCWGRAPPGILRRPLGVGRHSSLRRGMPFLRVGPGARRGFLFLCALVPVPSPCWPLGGFLLPRCVASGALSLWAPACHSGPFRAPLSECPFLSLALPLPVPFPFPVCWWRGGGQGGGLEPLAKGSGGVGGAESLDRVPEEGLPCRLRHDGLRGGLLGVGGGAGADLLESVHHVHPFSPSRSPGPLHPAAELLQGGGRPPGKVGRGLGGEGSELEVLEWREEDVDMRRWRAWRSPGERVRRWRGLVVDDGYGRHGEREARWAPWGEGLVDMGRRWRAWRRLGERERWWRGLGLGVAYGRRGEREAEWGSWGEGEVDVGRRWRVWWCLGERERQERGPGGSWWRLGEQEGREWVVEARWRCGECGRRGRVRRAGGERDRRRLRDRASLLELGQSGGVGGSWGASRGAAWYWAGKGGPPPSMDPPCRGAVAAAAGGTGRVTVPGGVGPGGPLGRGRDGRGDTVPVTGGVAPGGRWGTGVERLVAAIPYAGAARARGVVARWGRVVGSGSGGAGVGGGGGGAAGGSGAGSGGDGAAGMALGPLVDIPVPLVGVGGRASCAVPGAVLFGGQRGRVRGRG